VLFLLIVPVHHHALLARNAQRTLELLLTSPVVSSRSCWRKFRASVTMIALDAVAHASQPSCWAIYAEPDWGPIYSGFLGLFLSRRRAQRGGPARVRPHPNQIVAA